MKGINPVTRLIRIPASLLVGRVCLSLQGFAEEVSPVLNERLGYAVTDKLLIIHTDDVGISHEENAATFSALKSDRVTLESVIVPCAWHQEVADYAKQSPEADFGIHWVSSEGHAFNWDSIASKSGVPALINSLGYFYKKWRKVDPLSEGRRSKKRCRAQLSLLSVFGMGS